MPIAALEATSPEPVFRFLETRVSARDRRHWDWKYQLDGPPSARAFYHLGADGAVGGFIGVLPTTLHAAETHVPAGWFVDWATGTGEGSVGAGVALLRHAERQTGVLLTLVGSEDTKAILPKLRWASSDAPATWVLRLSTRAIGVRGFVRDQPWLEPLARAAALPLQVAARLRPPDDPFTLEEVTRFPQSYDTVWAERRTEFAPLMDRASAQLNFMTADYPGGGYLCYVVRDAERLVGHLVLRLDEVDGLVRGRLIDLLWPRQRPGAAATLVRQASWILQERGADYIECTASAADLAQALRACRFRRERPVPVWYHRLPQGVPPPDSWFITYLDCDRAYR